MKNGHDQEREQFRVLFKNEHLDNFEDRLTVLDIFLKTEQHITAPNITQRLQAAGTPLSLSFVQETLELMHRYGFAHKNRFDNGELSYEHRHMCQHHDHLICTKCGHIAEFKNQELENLQIKVASSLGFHLLRHKMELYGICSACLADRSSQIPLSAARQGEILKIKEIKGGKKAYMRLISMGLRPGDEIKVITNQNQGQMVLSLDCKRVVLGKGIAAKVMVEPLSDRVLKDSCAIRNHECNKQNSL